MKPLDLFIIRLKKSPFVNELALAGPASHVKLERPVPSCGAYIITDLDYEKISRKLDFISSYLRTLRRQLSIEGIY
jgi:hypothetical protein